MKNELRIIELLATGYTCKQIAEQVGYHEPTMETYIGRIRKKYGATNTPHLINIAHQQGILKCRKNSGEHDW